MKPAARARLNQILAGMTHLQAGVWLDEQVKRTRQYQSWHFIAFPPGKDEEVLDEANLVTMVNRTIFNLQHRSAKDTAQVKKTCLY